MYRNEFEMSGLIQARQADVIRTCQRTTVRPAFQRRPVANRVRQAIGHRFVVIGTALVGPL